MEIHNSVLNKDILIIGPAPLHCGQVWHLWFFARQRGKPFTIRPVLLIVWVFIGICGQNCILISLKAQFLKIFHQAWQFLDSGTWSQLCGLSHSRVLGQTNHYRLAPPPPQTTWWNCNFMYWTNCTNVNLGCVVCVVGGSEERREVNEGFLLREHQNLKYVQFI